VVLPLLEWIFTLQNGVTSSNGISRLSTLHTAPGIQTTPYTTILLHSTVLSWFCELFSQLLICFLSVLTWVLSSSLSFSALTCWIPLKIAVDTNVSVSADIKMTTILTCFITLIFYLWYIRSALQQLVKKNEDLVAKFVCVNFFYNKNLKNQEFA